jgi:hypothetical protein
MAELINRPAAGRIECLFYLLKDLKVRFGTTNEFSLNDAKYTPARKNVHLYCKLLVSETNLNINYCPYLTNILSKSGCALTNSLEEDTQKQKAVSNTINALHGLGLINRGSSKSKISKRGSKIADIEFGSNEFGELISESITQYGPLIGMLGLLHVNKIERFTSASVQVGYPNSGDKIEYQNKIIPISVGSQKDSNVRTRSVLLSWAINAGFIEPEILVNRDKLAPHIFYRDYLLRDKRTDQMYRTTDKISEFFSGRHTIERPLDYEHLIKNVKALREKGQEIIRNETMKVSSIIRNRRFAILYFMNKAFTNSSGLEFENLYKFMKNYEELFVIKQSDFKSILARELNICFSAGIPFEAMGKILKPLNGIDEKELLKNAPDDLIEVLLKYEN